MNWAAKMAVGLDTGVPWVMCKDDNAPDPIVCISSSIFSKKKKTIQFLNFILVVTLQTDKYMQRILL